MSTTMPITFAIAVNNRAVLERNFLASPCLRGTHPHQILIQEGFSSAAKAYNDAIDRSHNDLIVFCHQDIIFPEYWLLQLGRALDYLESEDPPWGVLGCYGETSDYKGRGHIYSSGRGVLGMPFDRPVPIQTLDEIVLILRKSSGLRFDERLPHFHLYGADICMAAMKKGMKNYAISAFCIHNTHQYLVLPKEFYECYRSLKRSWKKNLPIQTTCIKVTKFDLPMYKRRLQEVYLRYIRRKEVGATREDNVQRLLEEFRTSSN
ncbi:MAG: glycosyltransferase family protein [Acidobacteriia bacterium]|nr:glycosyltransferase family protein [Terriglobia bacterium]